ncbi:MAG: DUF6785 family protein [Armatimonadota bacterium]
MSTESRDRALLHGLTWRSVLISLIIIPANCYWVVQMEIVRYSAHPTTVSLFFNTIFILLVLSLLNMGLRRIAPGAALSQPELLVIYTTVSIASCVAGHDGIQVLAPMLSWPFRFATPQNNWEQLFWKQIPPWLAMRDDAVMEGYYLGATNLYTPERLAAWATPVLAWSLFIVALLVVMLCLNAILRKQWLEGERLTCPLVYLPVEISQPRPTPYRSAWFWAGFAAAAGIDTWNSFAFHYPQMPRIPIEHRDMSVHLRGRPWNAVGWTPISFYPFLIGVGFLMPTDFLFSCWFFYLLWKAQRVASAALGLDQVPDFPYINQQAFGAYMMFCLVAVWLGRRYLRNVIRSVLGGPSDVSEEGEPVSYRAAAVGIVLAGTGLLVFCSSAGMSLWLAAAFFAVYFALSVAITRMRAQFGSPVHDLHFTGPDTTITTTLGTRLFRARDLTMMSLFFWFNRAYRNHPMPHQMEGFKMVERSGASPRRFFGGMLLASVISTLAAWWAMLHLMYRYGASAKSHTFGPEAFNRLASWLAAPTGPNWGATAAVAVGLGVAFFLEMMRMRFVTWPLHPLGFAISGSWEMNLVWMPLLIAWVAKVTITRYAGFKTFRVVVPFFHGLILGQFVVGSILNIVSIAMGIPSYMFWQ